MLSSFGTALRQLLASAFFLPCQCSSLEIKSIARIFWLWRPPRGIIRADDAQTVLDSCTSTCDTAADRTGDFIDDYASTRSRATTSRSSSSNLSGLGLVTGLEYNSSKRVQPTSRDANAGPVANARADNVSTAVCPRVLAPD